MTPTVSLDQVSDASHGGVITIGNFDGVHRGHASLLREVRHMADTFSGPAIAIILHPHPASILRPQLVPPKLTWIQRRAELLYEHGMDQVVVAEVNKAFLAISAETFFETLILGNLAPKGIVEGPNFFFGRGRTGNVETLKQYCQQHDVALKIVSPTSDGEDLISSTRIRRLLEAGQVEAAADMLDRPHRVRGMVRSGAGRGRQIGFPTANVEAVDVVVPKHGVYGGWAWTDGQPHLAAIHIGPTPTFEKDGASRLEVHLLDYTGDLYDQPLLVDFVMSVRDIARFDSPEQLIEQLSRDVTSIRSRLAAYRPITSDIQRTRK